MRLKTSIHCTHCGEYTQAINIYDLYNEALLPPCPKCLRVFVIKLEEVKTSEDEDLETQAQVRQTMLDLQESDPHQLGHPCACEHSQYEHLNLYGTCMHGAYSFNDGQPCKCVEFSEVLSSSPVL